MSFLLTKDPKQQLTDVCEISLSSSTVINGSTQIYQKA